MNIPKPTEAGKESTIVVGPLLLADPEGKISKEDLQAFFEEVVAPAWYRRQTEKETRREEPDGENVKEKPR